MTNKPRSLGARRIYEALREQIAAGVYAPGAPMPSTRSLAAEFGVARSTVSGAYEQLLSEGFVESRQGARTRVRPLPPSAPFPGTFTAAPPGGLRLSAYAARLAAVPDAVPRETASRIADFRYGQLAGADFPTLLWKRAVNAAAAARPDRLAYDDPRGSVALRRALQAYLWRARGLRCGMDQIVVVNGSQQGLDLCARLLLDPGDAVAMEDPGYAMARQVFAVAGAAIVPVEADRDGMRTSLLGDVDARLAFVTPSHQFPLGGVLPVGRRHELLAWAHRRGAYVIEDDYDSEYRYDVAPVPPLHALGGAGNVIYVGTLSKTLSPALRLGYLVVPPELGAAFAALKRLSDRHAPKLDQEALSMLIASGAYERHVRRARRRNAARRHALLQAIRRHLGDRVSVGGTDAGLHVVVWCRDVPAAREDELAERARLSGVGLYPVSPAYAAPDVPHRPDCAGFIVGYASLDAQRIDEGMAILAAILPALR